MQILKNFLLPISWVVIAANLVSCAVVVQHTPSQLQHMESSASTQGVDIADAHANFVSYGYLFTLSVSVSHIKGSRGQPLREVEAVQLPTANNAPLLSAHVYKGACPLERTELKALRQAVDNAFARISPKENWRSFAVSMNFLPANVEVSKTVMAMHWGRHVDLRFYFKCEAPTATRDTFYGLLTSIHETTHAMAKISAVPAVRPSEKNSIADEQLAEGGAACVYQAMVEKGKNQKLIEALPPVGYFGRSWELRSSDQAWTSWCDRWERSFH